MGRSTLEIWIYCMLGIITVYAVYIKIRENAFQSGYWKGRADGWRIANRSRDLIDADND